MFSKDFRPGLFFFLIVLFLSGCAVGPNYKRPAYEVGKQFRYSSSADSLTFADSSWTYLYKDPVLQDLIRKGLANNFDLKIAFDRVNEARASFKQARAEVWPSVNADGSAGLNRQQTPAGGTIDYKDAYLVGNLSWEIDIWGKLRRAKQSARAQMFAQESYRQSIQISLIAEIASAYFKLLELADEVQITKENVRIREEALELVKAKLVAGTVSGLVVAQAEAELAQIKTMLPAYERSAGIQENALRLLVGELPGSVTTGDSITGQINMDIIPQAGIPSRLIVRRPDIMAVEQQLVSANAEIGVARAMMLPSLSINANVGYSTLGVGMISSVAAGLVGPIFSFGKLRANVERTKAVKEEMLTNYQKTIYTAIQEVSNGILAVDKQKSIVLESQNLVAAAQSAFDMSNQLFNAGYASYLDVLEAQRSLYNAQLSESRNREAQLSYLVNLYLALGGGWK